MAHLKDLVVNGNSRTLGTSYATNYSGKWEGISNDINTENTSDTWVPVLTNGVLQHRSIPAAYNNEPSTLSVNYAKTSGTANNVAWGGVTGKPATYTPSAHTHNIIVSYGRHYETASGTTDNAPTTGMANTTPGLYMTQSYTDASAPTYYGNIINIVGEGTGQLMLGWSGISSELERLYYRCHRDNAGGWSRWGTVAYLDDITWNNVSGKPSTYTPASHTHAIGDISNLQNTINSINSNKADLKYLNDNFYSVSSIDNKVNAINSAIGGKYSSSGGTLNGDLSFPGIGDTDSSKGIVWGGSTDGAKIYYKTAAADKGQLVLHMDDDSDTTINFEWNTGGSVSTKSYISSDGVYHGTATYANSAGSATTAASANSVAWNNVSGKPSTYNPSSHTHGLVEDSHTKMLPAQSKDLTWETNIASNNDVFWLYSLRLQNISPEWAVGNFGAGIAFGGADTKGVITLAYDGPVIRVAGGNGTAPVWYVDLIHTRNIADQSVKYATTAGSANNVAWANISGKPSITYYGDESNLPSEYTGANVWKSPS